MNYNYDEAEIIKEMFELYDINNKNESIRIIYNNIREILYNLVIYNDGDNIIEIINEHGGIYQLTLLFENKYKNSDLLEIDISNSLNYYNLLAFIGLFDYLYTTILGVIEELEIESIDNLCNSMAIL